MEFHFFVKNVITIKANPKYTYKKKKNIRNSDFI